MVEKSSNVHSFFELKKYRSKDNGKIVEVPLRPEKMTDTEKRQFIANMKNIAISFEEKNNRNIIIYHREKEWWQMGGNSLLFYMHHLQPHFVLPKIRAITDRDYYGRHWDKNPGCAMIKNLDLFMNNLEKKAGAKLILDTPEIKIFRLKKAYDESVRQTYLNIVPAKEERFEAMVLPKVMTPATRQRIDLLNKFIIDKVVNLPEARRQIYGMSGVEISNWLALNFVKMTNGRISKDTFYKQALTRLDSLNDWLVYTKKFNVFDIDAYIRIAELIIEVRERIQNDITKV